MARRPCEPRSRFTPDIVFSGLTRAWFLADSPTRYSPLAVAATTLGVLLAPRAFAMITGLSPSRQAHSEFVVPKSIPMMGPIR